MTFAARVETALASVDGEEGGKPRVYHRDARIQMALHAQFPAEDPFQSFLSRLHLEVLADPVTRATPLARHFAGAVLLLDIAGFTELTENFALSGGEGAERLSDLLNAHFGPMTETIVRHGGDVLVLAGDSLLAVWPAASREGLAAATRLAARAALAVQSAVQSRELPGGITLRQRAGLSAGPLIALTLGGRGENWQFLVVGEPISHAGNANQEASSGSVVLTREAWQHIEGAGQGTLLPSGSVRLEALGEQSAIEPQAVVLPSAGEERVRASVPPVVRDRIDAGQGAWLAEFRTVSVLFVNLRGINLGPENLLAQLQSAGAAVQDVIFRYEGTIYQFLMDEKGITLVCAFGLPPLAHENDAARAAEAAIAIQRETFRRGITTSIGVTTEQVFCCVYGSHLRRQYTLVGPGMNLAARLMQAAAGQVLCDASTAAAGGKSKTVSFENLPAIIVKGKSAPVSIFRPCFQIEEPVRRTARPGSAAGIVGREAERQLLDDALAKLRQGESGVVVITGEAGIGKSTLVEHFRSAAKNGGVGSLTVAGDAIEKSTPYFAWRPVFAEVLGLPATRTVEDAWLPAIQQIPNDPLVGELAPLLNDVLALEIPENQLTAQMNERGRADSTQQILLRLLQRAQADAPLALILDDAHWLDSASWRLASLFAQSAKALVVISSRPLPEPLPEDYKALLERPAVRKLELQALPAADTEAMICRRLGVESLPREVAQFIQERTGGQPLFSEELALALRDAGLIEIEGTACHLSPTVFASVRNPVEHFRSLNMPSTLQGVITGRLDRLPVAQQLALKVGSVIGQSFSGEALREIYPVAADRERLPAMLHQLAQLGLICSPDASSYAFNHALIQDVVYDSVPYAHRRELHRAVAEWYERTGELQSIYPLLAHHWRRADDLPRAINCSVEAGSIAMRSFANQEAAMFFTQALNWDRERCSAAKITPDPRHHAQWELLLGKAYTNSSRYAEAREHIEQGLALNGRNVPGSTARATAALLGQVSKQFLHRKMPGHYLARNAARSEEILEFARAYEALTEIYYLLDLQAHCLYAVFRSLNLAEEVQSSPELARCYSSTGALLGFLTMHKSAESYLSRATDVAARVQNAAAHAWVELAKGVYYAGVGKWEKAEAALRESISVHDRLGDHRHGDDGRTSMAAVRYFQGDFAGTLEWSERVRASAEPRRDLRTMAEAARMRSYALLALEKLNEAAETLPSLLSLREALAGAGGTHRKEYVQAPYGRFHLMRHDLAAARTSADTGAAALARQSNSSYDFLAERSIVAQTYLQILEAATAPRERNGGQEDLIVATTKACKALSSYARVFPIGRPAAARYAGQLAWLKGRTRAAQKHWQNSLRAARTLNMRYDEALATIEIARHLPGDDASRDEHLQQARTIFRELGASADLAQLEKLEFRRSSGLANNP
jgi:class 3 adenylate cyclase/tetratricopeptide (TPR) repeat protein/ABC-type iron transport system FetAB ATPase subunit